MYGFLRDGDESFGLQRVVEGLVNDEENVRSRGSGGLIFGLGVIFRAGKQIGCAAKVGDELTDAYAVRCSRIKDRIGKRTSREAASGVGVHGSEAEIGIGHKSRTGFADILQRRESAQPTNSDLRII